MIVADVIGILIFVILFCVITYWELKDKDKFEGD